MFFASDHLLNRITDVNIIPGYRTDHCAITLTIKTQQEARGNGLWMFNVSHLNNEEYIQQIQSRIQDTLKQYAVPVYTENTYTNYKNYNDIQLTISECLFYETLIMMLRGESVKFSKQIAKRNRAHEKQLIQEIETTQEQFNASALESDLERLEVAKEKLERTRRPIVDGLIIRSRVAWHEEGEKNSKYFLSLEKRNSCQKNIQYIKEGDNIFSKTNNILSQFSKHMQNKYSTDINIEVNENCIAKNISKTLQNEHRSRLEAEVTLSELTEALTKMKKGKTPGSNGFPVEFFRKFWPELGPFLHRAFNASLTQNQKLPTHREGIIKMIPKQGKSPHEIKGWRPITLLNVDYKIVSTAMANRLKDTIDVIISPSQTAYISGRYIGENTRLLYDTLMQAKNEKINGIIAAADFESAFESVSWEYLRYVMEKMNFGPGFLKIIDLLYLNPENFSRIMINGHLGQKISLNRGIRQGDPVSGYLFNIAVEVLAGIVNNSVALKGINITPRKEIRISQYADDTILFLDGTTESLKGAINELSKFANISGLKVNLSKTSCLPIGSLTRNQLPTNIGMQIVDELKVLGITISTNIDNITTRNIQNKTSAILRDISQWKRRNLTPLGKICIIKALLVSKLVHIFTALPNPSKQCLKEIENMLFNFVWDGKNDKIKRTKLMQGYEKDGLKMVNIKAFSYSMKLTWIKRLINAKADWKEIANALFASPNTTSHVRE